MPRSSTARARLVACAASRIHASSYASSYASASVADLCSDADARKGSFYCFFPSKRDLALAAIDEQWANTRRTILEAAFAPDSAWWPDVSGPTSPWAAPAATWRLTATKQGSPHDHRASIARC